MSERGWYVFGIVGLTALVVVIWLFIRGANEKECRDDCAKSGTSYAECVKACKP